MSSLQTRLLSQLGLEKPTGMPVSKDEELRNAITKQQSMNAIPAVKTQITKSMATPKNEQPVPYSFEDTGINYGTFEIDEAKLALNNQVTKDLWGDIARGAGSMGISFARSVPIIAKAAMEWGDSVNTEIYKAVGLGDPKVAEILKKEGVYDFRDSVLGSSQFMIDSLEATDKELVKGAKNPWIVTTGGVVGNITIGMLAGLATRNPGVAAAIMTIPEAAPFYENARKQGYNPTQSIGIATAVGVPVGYLNKLSAGAWIKSSPAIIQKFLPEGFLLKTGLEAGTETIQQGEQNAVEKLFINKDKNLLDGLVESALGGALGSIGIAGMDKVMKNVEATALFNNAMKSNKDMQALYDTFRNIGQSRTEARTSTKQLFDAVRTAGSSFITMMAKAEEARVAEMGLSEQVAQERERLLKSVNTDAVTNQKVDSSMTSIVSQTIDAIARVDMLNEKMNLRQQSLFNEQGVSDVGSVVRNSNREIGDVVYGENIFNIIQETQALQRFIDIQDRMGVKISDEVRAKAEDTLASMRVTLANSPITNITTQDATISAAYNPDGTYNVSYNVELPDGSSGAQGVGSFDTEAEALFFGKQKVISESKSNPSERSSATIDDVNKQYDAWTDERDALPLSRFAEITDPEIRDSAQGFDGPFKLADALYDVAKEFSNRIWEGGLRGSMGRFFTRTKNMNLKGINNVSVFAHELFHAVAEKEQLHKKLSTSGDPIVKDLEAVYDRFYPKGAKVDIVTKVHEGFATAFQKYIENPAAFRKDFPELSKALFDKGGRLYTETTGRATKRIQSIVAKYQSLNTLQKLAAHLASDNKGKLTESLFSMSQKARMFLANKIMFQEVMEQKAGVKQWSSASIAPMLYAQRATSAVVQHNLNSTSDKDAIGGLLMFSPSKNEFVKVIDYNYSNFWDLIIDIGKKERGDVDAFVEEFDGWLVARRINEGYNALAQLEQDYTGFAAITEEDGNAYKDKQELEEKIKNLKDIIKNDGRTQEDVSEGYKAGKDLFEKKFDNAPASLATMYDKLNEANLTHLYEVGRISEESYEQMKGVKGYASFMRQKIDDFLMDEAGKEGVASFSQLKRRRGGESAIISPLFSQLVHHEQTVKRGFELATKNRLGTFYNEHFPDMWQELPYTQGDENNKDLFVYTRGDKKISAKAPGELLDSLAKAMTPRSMETMDIVLNKMKQVFSTSTTGLYISFAIANLTLDAITTAAQTQSNTIPVVDAAQIAWARAQNKLGVDLNEKDKELVQYANEYFSIFSMTHALARMGGLEASEAKKLMMKELDAINGWQKVVDKTKKGAYYPIDKLLRFSEEVEVFNRLAEYVNSRKNGDTQLVAGEKAGQVTAPFHHVGTMERTKLGAIVLTNPFYNVGYQVGDKLVSLLSTKEGVKAVSKVMALIGATMFAGVASIMMGDDEDKKNQLRKKTGDQRSKYIYYNNPFSKDLGQVRVPDAFAAIPAAVNMLAENVIWGGDYKQEDFYNALTEFVPQQLKPWEVEGFLTTHMVPGLKSAVSIWANKKTFPTGAPVVQEWMKKMPTRMQKDTNTSWLATALANDMLSPIQIDFILENELGRSVKAITKPDQLLTTMNPFTSFDYPYGGRYMEKYFAESTRIEKEMFAIKKKTTDLSPEKIKEIEAQQDQLEPITKLMDKWKKKVNNGNGEEAKKAYEELNSSLKNWYKNT